MGLFLADPRGNFGLEVIWQMTRIERAHFESSKEIPIESSKEIPKCFCYRDLGAAGAAVQTDTLAGNRSNLGKQLGTSSDGPAWQFRG